MDRRPHSYAGGRPNVKAPGNVSNVGSPAFSQYSGSGRTDNVNPNSTRGPRRKNRRPKNAPYFSDNMLLTRMKQYLEENTQSIQVDFDHMVEYFQTKFRDYSSRKQAALRGLLVRGHDAIMAEFRANADYTSQIPSLLPGSPGTSEDFAEDDDEMMDSFNESANQSNMQLMSLYNSRRSSQHMGQEDEQEELINISSSDEGSSEAKKLKTEQKNEARPIRPLLPPHILSVIRKGDTDVFPTGSYNGGAHHGAHLSNSTTVLPQATITTAKFNTNPQASANASSNAYANEDRSRKRKATAVTEGRKIVTGPAKKKREVPALSTTVTFKNFGGNARVLTEVCKLLVHMRHPEVYRQIGVSPPRGFLLHGPPGCGKTLLAHAIAGELKVPLIKVASPELVAGVSGESEERIRDLFAQAVAAAPCVLFLDEVDAVTPNRHTAQREMERRIVAQLLSSLDELGQAEFGDQVLVIGATNRPDSIDPALRRAGRFDREVCLGIPDLAARRQILEVLCGKLRLAPGLSFDDIAQNTPGYVGADLMALTREAAMAAVSRVFGELKHAAAAEKQAEKLTRKQVAKPIEKPVMKAVEIVTKKPIEEVILVADEPKAKQNDIEDKDDVVDVEVDDSAKIVENGKTKNDDKMEVCEVAGDNNDCIVLDETPKKNAELKDAGGEEGKVTAGEDKKDTAKQAEKAGDEQQKSEDKMETEAVELVSEAKETEGGKQESHNATNGTKVEGLKEESVEPEPITADCVLAKVDSGGPDLAELISWLHDVAPLTKPQLELLHVERRDFELALKAVQPSAKREGFATVPDVTWDDVGALADIRDELQMAILAPVKHAEQFAALGLTTPTGVLLCGPPGCGKTFLAKAVANEAGINFISVKGPELLNMYVGESERAVRQCFQRARNSAPCVIFFDELDALCPKRSDSGEGGASMRVVNQMLTEMDGVEGRKDVYLMAATNRPDIVDPAVLRPGRLDKILYVGMPNGPDRVLILQALTKDGSKPTLCPDVSLARLGNCNQTDGYTGADLAALVREASMQSLREHLAGGTNDALAVADKHFNLALAKIRPSVSVKDRKYYEKLREVYTAVPAAKSVE